ncbi:MAG: efflux RND transporter periplasmic adaptor subunit, partial [Planctomycetota bacterium]
MSRNTLILLGVPLLLALGYLVSPQFLPGSETGAQAADMFVVERGPMKVRITEAASLYAAKSVNLRSQVEGRAAILSLIPEGEYVQKGDKVAELDVSQIKDRSENQAITLSRAQAALITAEKELEIQKNQNASDIERSENELLFARLDLEKFEGKDEGEALVGSTENGGSEGSETMGESEQQRVAADNEIRLSEEELKRATERLHWTRRLFDKKYVTENDLEADKLNVLKAENKLTLARNRKHLLENYTLPMQRRQLEAKVKEAEASLQRTKLRCDAKLVQRLADLNSKKQQKDLEQAKFDKYREQIEAGIVRAPAPGLVVYSTIGDRRRREPIEEGTEVREGQSIVILPDVSTMKVKASIHESQVERVRAGLPVTMKVDALPDKVFFGRVKRVSVVPDSSSSWFNPEIKLYTTHIDLDGDTTDLRPGQSASVEIQVADLEDVLAVPVHAVHRRGRVLYAWKETASGPLAVPVKTGISNDQFVRILEGLAEGERIYLSEPRGVEAPDFAELNEQLLQETEQRQRDLASTAEASMNNRGKEARAESRRFGRDRPRGERERSRGT